MAIFACLQTWSVNNSNKTATNKMFAMHTRWLFLHATMAVAFSPLITRLCHLIDGGWIFHNFYSLDTVCWSGKNASSFHWTFGAEHTKWYWFNGIGLKNGLKHSVHGVQSAFAERKNVDNVERFRARSAGGVETMTTRTRFAATRGEKAMNYKAESLHLSVVHNKKSGCAMYANICYNPNVT